MGTATVENPLAGLEGVNTIDEARSCFLKTASDAVGKMLEHKVVFLNGATNFRTHKIFAQLEWFADQFGYEFVRTDENSAILWWGSQVKHLTVS